jgi:hypothetical protein
MRYLESPGVGSNSTEASLDLVDDDERAEFSNVAEEMGCVMLGSSRLWPQYMYICHKYILMTTQIRYLHCHIFNILNKKLYVSRAQYSDIFGTIL